MKKIVLAVFAAALCFAGASFAAEKAAEKTEASKAPAKTEAPKVVKGGIVKIDKEKSEIVVATGKDGKVEKTFKVEAKLLETLKVGDRVSISRDGDKIKVEKIVKNATKEHKEEHKEEKKK